MVGTSREDEGHIHEMVRRKLARRLRKAPLLAESLSDESETDGEPDRSMKDSRH